MSKNIVRYIRKKKIHNEDLENTPFEGLLKDICGIILDHLYTEDVFTLMTVSKNTKIVASDEIFWKKRIYILFLKSDIDQSMFGAKLTDKIFHASGYKYRLLTIKLISTGYSNKRYLEVLTSRFEQFAIPVMDSCVEAIQNTISRYIKYLSLRPLSEFTSIIKSVFPERLDMASEFLNFHISITEKFDKTNNRYGLVDMFIDLMIFIYYVIRPAGAE